MKRLPQKPNLKTPARNKCSGKSTYPAAKNFCHLFTADRKHAAIVWNLKNQIVKLYLPQASLPELNDKIVQENKDLAFVKPKPKIAFLIKQIRNYFSGKTFDFAHYEFDLKDLNEFARQVLTELVKIVPGQTISYGQLAQRLGKQMRRGQLVGLSPAIPFLF